MSGCLCQYLAQEQRAAGATCTPCQHAKQGNLFAALARPELLSDPQPPAFDRANRSEIMRYHQPETGNQPSENGRGNMPGFELQSDVERVIEAKAGTFTRTLEGAVVATYQLHVLADGRVFEHFLTGALACQRVPSHVTLDLIESSIKSGLWREVTRG